jgi:hypothetical protein
MKRVSAVLTIVAAGVLGTGASPATAGRTVCMSAPDGCSVRPHVIPYGAHAAIRRIRWKSWGGERAVGYGALRWGATVTEPAAGPFAAKIIMSEAAECEGRLWYSRQTIKIGRHYGRHLESNEAVGPCYYP